MSDPTAEAKAVAAKAEADAEAAKSKANLVAPSAKTKMVRIRALAPISVKGDVIAVGATVEVDEATAAEFADRVFQGNFSFSGERARSGEERHMTKRAERVA